MSFQEEKRESIKRYMLDKLRKDDTGFIQKTMENFGISITTVKRYIKECVTDEILKEDKDTKTGYSMISVMKDFTYTQDGNLSEDRIFYEDILPLLQSMSKGARNIWSYVFMEIMNNAIEHSQGQNISCHIMQDYLYTEISITDDGIGIFNNIQKNLSEKLGTKASIQDAILELHKGKFTSNPACHSGEGIFFSSKMMRELAIWSDQAIYSYGCYEKEKLVQSHLISYYTRLQKIGTLVVMKLENQTTRKPQEVFNMYAPIDEGFIHTIIPIKEACPYGEPIARSQARRVLYRLEQFKKVEFDFTEVEFMGQGFADEVFRVFQNQHPDIELLPIHANQSVLGMIKHVTT
ncbi:STAS-like domain-containing protein [Bariatricus sp. SGI.154]|uniref:STAS-like domain-containing protein n=1 Tax=Bariatricus sp. SGI.154 TaxID=3420549 RepID=UPI003D009BC9